MPTFGMILKECREKGVGLPRSSTAQRNRRIWWKQSHLADVCDVSEDSIQAWEADRTRPERSNFLKLKNAFSVHPEPEDAQELIAQFSVAYENWPGAEDQHKSMENTVENDPPTSKSKDGPIGSSWSNLHNIAIATFLLGATALVWAIWSNDEIASIDNNVGEGNIVKTGDNSVVTIKQDRTSKVKVDGEDQ